MSLTNKNKILGSVIITACLIVGDIGTVSVVYNIRISEITRRQSYNTDYAKPSIAILTFFDQQRWRYDTVREHVNAGLANYIYLSKKIYFKLDVAAGNVGQTKVNAPYFSRNQTDDVLLSCGYYIPISTRARITLSGKFGFPTHADFITQGIQLGTGHVGLGAQIDAAVAVSKDRKHSLMAALRYIRYFPSTIYFTQSAQPYRFNIGNLSDILISYVGGTKRNRYETGYNASFVFKPTIYPFITTPLANQSLGIRSNFYGSFTHFFLVKGHPSAVIVGASYGFDNKPLIFKRLVSCFGAWGINF